MNLSQRIFGLIMLIGDFSLGLIFGWSYNKDHQKLMLKLLKVCTR